MRVLRGLAEARNFLCENRGLNLDQIPPQIQSRTREIFGKPLTPTQVVESILKQVRDGGDAAVRELSRALDGSDVADLGVPPSAIAEAYDKVPDELSDALTVAANRIRKFHEASLIKSWMDFSEGYGALVNPVERVGTYVPGGTASYPRPC